MCQAWHVTHAKNYKKFHLKLMKSKCLEISSPYQLVSNEITTYEN